MTEYFSSHLIGTYICAYLEPLKPSRRREKRKKLFSASWRGIRDLDRREIFFCSFHQSVYDTELRNSVCCNFRHVAYFVILVELRNSLAMELRNSSSHRAIENRKFPIMPSSDPPKGTKKEQIGINSRIK